MSLHLHSLTFDCDDPPALAAFWAGVTGYRIEVSEPWLAILAGDGSIGPRFMFIRVPEPKTAKNRVHLDVRPTGTMQEEVDRLIGLGATVRGFIEKPASIIDGQATFWTQMYDVEGNEFCVLRGPGDGWVPGEL